MYPLISSPLPKSSLTTRRAACIHSFHQPIFPAFFLPLKRSSLKNPTVLETGPNLQKLAKPLSANMTPKLTFSAALSCTALRRSTPLTYF